MIVRSIGQVLLAASMAFASTACDASDLDSWLEWSHATGQWNGSRQRWVEKGIEPQASWVIDVLGNPAGGKKKAAVQNEWNLSLP